MIRIALFSLVLFLSAISIAGAQQPDYFDLPDKKGQDKYFYGALVAGINASQIDGDNYAGFHKAGLNMGLASYIKLKPKWIVSLELLYSQKGARNVEVGNSPAVGSVPLIYTAKLNYAEIPLMINYRVQERIWAGLGASYSRLFSYKENMDSYVQTSINTQDNPFRQGDINYLVAVSYQVSYNFFARARYQYSMTTIRDRNHIPIEFGTPVQYNNLFALQFVLLF